MLKTANTRLGRTVSQAIDKSCRPPFKANNLFSQLLRKGCHNVASWRGRALLGARVLRIVVGCVPC